MAQILQFPGVQTRGGWATVDPEAARPVDFPAGLFIRAREAVRFAQDMSAVVSTCEDPEAAEKAIDKLVDRLITSDVMFYEDQVSPDGRA